MPESGQIRPSMLISTFGPGSILELPDTSVVVSGIDDWNRPDCHEIIEPRISARLSLGGRRASIKSVPISTSAYSRTPTLPTRRFPVWYVCPQCRRLAPYRDFFEDNGIFYCQECSSPGAKVRTFPSRFVVACHNGHLDDLPWRWFLHQKYGNFNECNGGANANGKMLLLDEGSTGAITDIVVKCMECKKSRSLSDAFDSATSKAALGSCHGARPWLGHNAWERNCDAAPRAMLRGASNIYFSCTLSALSIPPFTGEIHQTVDPTTFDNLAGASSIEALYQAKQSGFFRDLFERFSVEDIWRAIEQQNGLGDQDAQNLYVPEWNALTGGSTSEPDFDFQTVSHPAPDGFNKWITSVVQVHRLREVRVLTGFTRIDPPPDLTAIMSGDTTILKQAPLARTDLRWFPGVETRGEGIFLQFNEDEVRRWENGEPVKSAAAAMEKAYQRYHSDRNTPNAAIPPFPGARYVLLHTLSHLIMRRLCLQCGYSLASIRERIYCSHESPSMAGILFYTATPDSEGSLGGLVEFGDPSRFKSLLWNAVEDARSCSADPLCSEYRPETTGSLNSAACHVCLLLPETSCERSNRFLDRAFVAHTMSVTDCAFFE